MTHGHFDKKCFIENLLCPSKVDNFWEASKRNHSINLSLTRSNLQVVSYHSYFTMDLFPPSLRQTMFHTLLEWTIIKGMSLSLGRARHLETFNLQLHLCRSSITMFHYKGAFDMRNFKVQPITIFCPSFDLWIVRNTT